MPRRRHRRWREQLGLDEVRAGVTPEGKGKLIAELQAQGLSVAMAGDGVNDAPALAAADVGVAMGTGADVAVESAGVTLVRGDLTGIVRARTLARATMRNIRQNLFFAFIYNSAGVPLAAGLLYPLFGLLLSPMLAAVAMSLSSVSVIGNALRLGGAGWTADRATGGAPAISAKPVFREADCACVGHGRGSDARHVRTRRTRLMQLAALRHSGFRLYFLCSVASVNSTWIVRVIIAWSAWDLTGSAKFAGLIAAMTILPVAAVGPFFGVMTDRADIDRAFLRVNLGFFVVALALFALLVAGALTPPVLLALALGFGGVSAAYHPVRQSLAPRLVERGEIPSVVALQAMNFNLARMISPGLGGLAISTFGIAPTAALAVLLMLPNMFVMRFLTPRPFVRPLAAGGLLAEFRAGLHAAVADPRNREAILLTVLGTGFVRGMLEILSVIADRHLDGGVELFGIMGAAVGVGALLAIATQVALNTVTRGLVRIVLAGGVVASLVLAQVDYVALALLAVVVCGYCAAFTGVAFQSEIQSTVADDVRGRVMSIYMLGMTGSVSAYAYLFGLLSDTVGLEGGSLVLAAGSLLLIVIGGFAIRPR